MYTVTKVGGEAILSRKSSLVRGASQTEQMKLTLVVFKRGILGMIRNRFLGMKVRRSFIGSFRRQGVYRFF
jgi:hypothetical protein